MQKRLFSSNEEWIRGFEEFIYSYMTQFVDFKHIFLHHGQNQNQLIILISLDYPT